MTRVVVTGAAGFIGSNIVKGLNARGIDDIIAVDDLTQGDKFRNLADLQIADYVDADEFYDLFAEGAFGKVEAVFHEGACSDTMETDGKYMMDNNYTLSCWLVRVPARSAAPACSTRLRRRPTAARTPSAKRPSSSGRSTSTATPSCCSTSGCGANCGDDFGRAKTGKAARWSGFRYFNVYGPREQHKGRMASVAFHQFNQFRAEGKVKLFGEYGGYGAGRAEARLRLHRRRGGREPVVPRPPGEVRHLQPGQRPSPAVQ